MLGWKKGNMTGNRKVKMANMNDRDEMTRQRR